MANERTYPILPCRDLDEAISFYESLGFKKTYRQTRPNPSAVVALEEIQIHLFGMEGFDPVQSYGSVIIAVPAPDGLYQDFAAGLGKRYGTLPVAGIPRILRPRKKLEPNPSHPRYILTSRKQGYYLARSVKNDGTGN